jgi:hypothetical protein
MYSVLLCGLLSLVSATGMCGSFDERLWEKYCEIDTAALKEAGALAGAYLEPQKIGDIITNMPFADFRLMTEQKEEVPWQVVVRRPEKRQEEIPARMRNLSLTKHNETWFELVAENDRVSANGIEIITPDSDFFRQTQVLGSPDGSSWNVLRKDGLIFDVVGEKKFRCTLISFRETGFRYFAIKITNGEAKPLTITTAKVLWETSAPEQTYTIEGTIEKPEIDPSRKISTHLVRMSPAFPIDRLIIFTKERNFHRTLEVHVKRETGDWERWAQAAIFNFDNDTIRGSHLSIDIPEVSAREFRLIFQDFDNPPLVLGNVLGQGYSRLFVFKQQPNHKLYLFWGNPMAKQPRYDLAVVTAKQEIDKIPIVYLGEVRQNMRFAGKDARLPFTERYKYLLYVVVIFAIIALVVAQYRVLRHVNPSMGREEDSPDDVQNKECRS